MTTRADEAPSARAPHVPCVTPAQLDARGDARIVDLRSPGEYAADHLPGAHNVPLFDDDERALVGTLYRRVSPQAAFDEGRRIVTEEVRALVGRIAELAQWRLPSVDLEERVRELTSGGLEHLSKWLETRPVAELPPRALVLHCWRGGLRSRSVAALLLSIGMQRALVLHGGYQAWRGALVRELDALALPPVYTLRGLTGVGKTLVLRELERLRPRSTIDLEQLAQHRSSILGGVGLLPVTQKTFETRVVQRARAGFGAYLVVEGESRKVGDVIVPRPLWQAMTRATHLELVAPLARRVEVLRDDYLAQPGAAQALEAPLAFLDERLGLVEGSPCLRELLARGEIERLVTLVLERYYDPRYRHGEQGRRLAARFDAEDPARCAREIADWIDADCLRRAG